MKQYVITQHPIKLTLEFDDEWLHPLGIDEDDMENITKQWESQIKTVAVALHSFKAQKDASEAMKGGAQ